MEKVSSGQVSTTTKGDPSTSYFPSVCTWICRRCGYSLITHPDLISQPCPCLVKYVPVNTIARANPTLVRLHRTHAFVCLFACLQPHTANFKMSGFKVYYKDQPHAHGS